MIGAFSFLNQIIMKTGFYNTDILSKEESKQLMKDALLLSYRVEVQSKYSERNKWRDIEPSISIEEALEIAHDLKMVNRQIQHPIEDDTCQGEITFMTISWNKEGWLLLYCFMQLDNLEKLAKKYNLEMN